MSKRTYIIVITAVVAVELVSGFMAYQSGKEAGKQWMSDQLSFERATQEDKNAFTQCLLERWEVLEERIDD